MTTRYDQVRYPSPARRSTYPGSFAAPAALLGFESPPLRRARVLEIGCGEAGNLLAMAVALPEAEFHGMDLAETAIAIGQADADALGLANIRLHAADILTYEPQGEFDYIIAHGVYAWVPEPVRQGVMRLIGRALAPGGLALVSYNVSPGCLVRGMVGESLHELLAGTGPDDRVAALPAAQALLKSEWADPDLLQAACLFELERMHARPPEVVFHDELGDIYAPQSIKEVAAGAKQNGLAYVCDASIDLLAALLNPTDAQRARLERAGGDWVRYERLDDIALLRQFRQSLFVRAERPLKASAPEANLDSLFIAAAVTVDPADAEGVRVCRTTAGASFRTNDPALCALLERLNAAYPQALATASLDLDERLKRSVLRLLTAGLIELSTVSYPMVRHAGERPLASPLARLQASRGDTQVSTLAHAAALLDTDDARQLLLLLDGTRTADEIAASLGTELASVQDGLDTAGRLGLLQA
jgi:SAM-dependent methyltransferase